MINKWQITIPELSGEEKRNVYLYLPESYSYEQEKRYPVLYMFDGHNVFFDSDATYGKCWGMKEYMDRTGRQLIIVAVECSHDPDNGRLKEYSPFPFTAPNIGKIPAWGKQTMEWMIHTLKAQIDRDYRTLSDREHTFIAGSSMGGMMSLYAVLAYNSVFSKAAALSPSIWTNMTRINKLIREAELAPDTTVYMDYGANEINFHAVMRKQFRKVTDLLLSRDVLLTSRIVPNGDHCEACWEKQIPYFMDALFYPETR